MHILYVVARPLEINTSASVRNFATIMGLLENGHTITLASSCPDKNHPAYDESLHPSGVKTQYFQLGGMQSVARVGRKVHLPPKVKSWIFHLLYGREIYDNLKGIINFVDEIDLQNIDIVISSSDPKSSHLFVDKLFCKTMEKRPWIQIWGDPFAADITRTDNKSSKVIAQEERRLLSKADKVVYVSKLTSEEQKQRYPDQKEKMCYIPIPYWKEKISRKPFPPNNRDIKLCYCGDYPSHIRNIRPVYEACKTLGLDLTLCGMSDLKLDSTDHIHVLPRQPASVVEKLESDADVLVFLSNKTGKQIPGKIYQYMATNKPILFILDGEKDELKNTFEPYNRVFFVENECDTIKEVLQSISDHMTGIINEPVQYFSAKNIAQMIIQDIKRQTERVSSDD